QSLSVLSLDERWELNQPGGSTFRQDLNNRVALRIPSQLAQRFQHGVICFFPAEAFHALPASNPHCVISDSVLMKRIHKRCLADSSFTSDKNDLSLTI